MIAPAVRSSCLRSLSRQQASKSLGARALAPSSVRCFSSSSTILADKPVGIDENITHSHPKMPSPSEAKGPEFIKGDRGSHAQRTLKSFSMQGKTCVVTGGARGLGQLMGRSLVESGCDQLAILDLNPKDAEAAASEMVKWMEQDGGLEAGEVDIKGFACDVSNEESVKDAFNSVKSAFGQIDVVINSAGIVENFTALEYPTEKMKKLYEINLYGSHYVAQEGARHMISQGTPGSIILVASMSGSIVNIPQPQTPYNASKAAVKHLGSCLAVEWAKHNIRVNTLSPGYILTSLSRAIIERTEETRKLKGIWESKIPMGRMGEPKELSGIAVFLASDASSYVTGADFIIDGGYTAV